MSATLAKAGLSAAALTLAMLAVMAFHSAGAPARPAMTTSAPTTAQTRDRLAGALPVDAPTPSPLPSSVVPAPSAVTTTATYPAGTPSKRPATTSKVPPPATTTKAPPPATITVSGHVTCLSGKAVEGVWVVGAQGGSGWAPWTSSAARPSYASFHKDIANGAWEVHVGCGGSPASWQVATYSSQVTGAVHDFTCQDTPGQPRYGQCWT
jgi:hypothetical protein